MRAYLPAYEMRQARSLDDALFLIASDGWRPFAGGTDLMVLLESGALARGRYVSIWGLAELRGINATGAEVSIGALTTYSEILESELLAREFPLLGRAARETGGIAIQNRGTIGGNIANASPAADTPPALLVYDAELEIVSTRGRRRTPYDGFHRGYKQMDLAPGELIARIIVKRGRSDWRQYYRKVGTRRAQAISKVCLAAAARIVNATIDDVRIACASVAPVPLRCHRTEDALRGRPIDQEVIRSAQAILRGEISPIDDIRSTAAYRERVTANLLAEFLNGTDGAPQKGTVPI